jgi:hypothetical protein
MDLRVLDVSSNPLLQPPLETCERGLHSMQRYYHCLKLEELAAPDCKQRSQTKYFSTMKKYEKSRMKMRKKKAFPSSLCPSSVFRTVSQSSSEPSELLVTLSIGETKPALVSGRERPPVRSVSFSFKGLANVDDRLVAEPTTKYASLDDSDSSMDGDFERVVFDHSEKVADEITVNETLKVIFVGMANSGKTSIIKRLLEGRKAKIPQKDERTIGVDIYNWNPKTTDGSLLTRIQLDEELKGRVNDNVDVKFSVWDFAGQHVYHVSIFPIICVEKMCHHPLFNFHALSSSRSLNVNYSRQLMNSFFRAKLCMCSCGIWAQTTQTPVKNNPRSRRKNMVRLG